MVPPFQVRNSPYFRLDLSRDPVCSSTFLSSTIYHRNYSIIFTEISFYPENFNFCISNVFHKKLYNSNIVLCNDVHGIECIYLEKHNSIECYCFINYQRNVKYEPTHSKNKHNNVNIGDNLL